jgi:hypothetical protein
VQLTKSKSHRQGILKIMKNYLLILTCVFILTSCTKDDENSNIFIESSIILKINNLTENNNFLNSVNEQNVKLFYDNNGTYSQLNYPGDYPKGFILFQEEPLNEKLIKVFSYVGGNNNIGTTYVEWNESDIDTLNYKINRYENGSISISEVKFNSVNISNDNEFGIYYVTKN